MSQSPDQYLGTSFLSVSRKKEALWNVVQPGDPYDIRKSMIAKVPFDKKTFMGDHLQLVCLFQAAQIQRLCEFLQDFRSRYREIERRQLDRHSYEVQIKQLTHKLAQEAVFRQDNEKMRQFIKNQSINKQGVEDSIKSKYEKLLLQAKGFEQQTLKLKHDNEALNFQMSSFDAKFEALKKSKQTQIEDIYMKMSQQSSMSSQLEFSSLKNQYQSEVQRLDLQNKRLKQSNQQKMRQIQSWQQKYRIIEQQLLRSSPKNDASRNEKKMIQYQNRFVIFGQQIDRLNLVIKEISHKYEIAEQRVHQYEVKYDVLNRDFLMLQSTPSISSPNNELLRRIADIETENKRLQQSGKLAHQYQIKLRQANDEILRLGTQFKVEIQNSNVLRDQVQRYQYEESRMRVLEKQLLDYKQEAENNNLKLKIAQDQNQVALLKQQIQRLHEELAKKGGYDTNHRNLMTEYQSLQTKYADSQRKYQSVTQQYEIKMNQKVSEYESRIQNINRSKGYEFESKASMLQSQVQRLGDQLRRKTEQVENYQKQIRQLEYTITNRYELDTSRKVQNYENVIQNLRRENEDIIRRVRELEPLQRKINQYENRSTITAQQIERLTQQIKSKDNDIENLRRQIREQQIAIVQKYEVDTSRKIGNYENNLNNLNRENQQLKRNYSEMQNKTALLSHEIQRLTNNLRQFQLRSSQGQQQIQRLQRFIKQSELNITQKYEFQLNQKISNYDTAIRNFQRENQEMKRRIVELQNGNRRLIEYENQLKLAGQQIQRLNVIFKSKQEEAAHLDSNNRNLIRQFQQLGRRYNELQANVRNKYEVQASRTITTLEQNITNFKRQNDDLKRMLQQYEGRVRQQNNDMQGLSVNIRNLAQQNQGLKRQIMQMENSYRNKFEVEVTNNYRSYETNLTETKRELQSVVRQINDLKRVLQNAQQSNIHLNQQNQDLRRRFQQDFGQAGRKMNEYETRISQLQAQNQGLRRKVNDLQVTIREKYEIEATRRISSLDQNLVNVTRENQELRRRFQLTSRQLEEFRRIVQAMEKDNEELVRRLRQYGDINKKVVEYQNKISFLAQQSERANLALKSREQDLNKAVAFINQLTQKLQNSERNMSQSQSSIQQFEIQVKTRISQYEQNAIALTQQNNELKRRLHILDDMNRKIAEYQHNIAILNQQLQRVNQNFKTQLDKSNQMENALRNAANQNENLRRNVVEVQNSVTQKYQFETTRVVRNLEQNIEALQRENNQLKKILTEYQQNLNTQNIELQKLALNFRNSSQQNNSLKNQLRQTQINIVRKLQTQVNTRQITYEKDVTNLRRQNQDLVRKIRQFTERIAPEYQNKIVFLKQQIDSLGHYSKQQSGQLSSNLNILSQQNDTLKRQILQIQQTYTQKLEGQVQRTYATYERNISTLQKENQQLKKYIQDLGEKFEGQMKSFGQRFTILQRQNQELKRNLQQLTFRYESESKNRGNVEQNLSGLARQNDDMKKRLSEQHQQAEKLVRKINELQFENETIKRQARQGESHIVQKFQSETTQQVSIYKQQITQIENQLRTTQKQKEDLQRRLSDIGGESNRVIARYEQDIKRFGVQIQRLNGRIKQYDTKLRQLSGQNQNLKRQVKDTEFSITQRLQSQLRSKVITYEQTISNLNRQNEELNMTIRNTNMSLQDKERNLHESSKRVICQLQSKVALMSLEIQRLTHGLRTKSDENQKMRQQIERLNNTLRLKLEESKQLETQVTKLHSHTHTEFTQLQSNYSLMTRENQNYKKHLLEYENSIKKLYGEFERLQNIINDLKRQREDLFQKNYALSTQIDRLLNENKDLETQVEDVRLRLSDESSLNKRINEHMALMVILFAEIQSLRQRVKDKEKEVEDVRRSSLAPFKLDRSRPKMDSI